MGSQENQDFPLPDSPSSKSKGMSSPSSSDDEPSIPNMQGGTHLSLEDSVFEMQLYRNKMTYSQLNIQKNTAKLWKKANPL